MSPPAWQDVQGDHVLFRDNPDADLFGFDATAAQLAEHLRALYTADPERVVVLSVEGPWGAGKTTLVDLVLGRLSPGAPPPWLEVHHNAWVDAVQDGGPWTCIADAIGERLYRWLQDGQAGRSVRLRGALRVTVGRHHPAPESTVEVTQGEDRRMAWRELAWRISHQVRAEAWDPALALYAEPHSRLAGRGVRGEEAVGLLGELTAALVALPIAAGASAKTAGAAIGQLARARRQQAEAPPPESARFVELLATLVERLGPTPAPGLPRLVLVLDDVSRLDEASLEALLRALAYLVRLRSALVVLALDREQAERVAPRVDVEGHEGPLARVLHLRQRVAQVPMEELAVLTRLYLDEVARPPLPAEAARALAEQLTWQWWQAGVRTPRMVKRALSWVAQRREPSAPVDPAALRALAALMPWQEGLLPLAQLLESRAELGLLDGICALPRNPLTGGAWVVQVSAEDAAEWAQLHDEVDLAHLPAWLRLAELARRHGRPGDLPWVQANLQPLLERWRSRIDEVVWGRALRDLPEGVAAVEVEALLDTALERSITQPSAALAWRLAREQTLAVAALRLHAPPDARTPGSPAGTLRDWPRWAVLDLGPLAHEPTPLVRRLRALATRFAPDP